MTAFIFLMDYKKLLRSFVASIVGFLLLTSLISVFTDFNTNSIIPQLFGSIYDYADKPSQTNFISILSSNCIALMSLDNSNPLEQQQTFEKYSAVCTNTEQLNQLKTACPNKVQYESLLSSTDYQLFLQSCELVESGELDKQCEMINNPQVSIQDINYTGLQKTCFDYKNGQLKDKDFFVKSIQYVIPPDIFTQGPLNGFMVFFEFVNDFAIILTIVFMIPFIVLYYKDWVNFALKLGGIFINIGVFILVPFLLVKVYISTQGLDTSFILNSIGTVANIQSQLLKTMIPIIVLNMYTNYLVFSGLSLLIFGIVLKVMLHRPNDLMNPRQQHIDNHISLVTKDKKRSI